MSVVPIILILAVYTYVSYDKVCKIHNHAHLNKAVYMYVATYVHLFHHISHTEETTTLQQD